MVTGWSKMRDAGWVEHEDDHDTESSPHSLDGAWLDADYLAEFAGRLCYQSWERPNPVTATNAGYLANIIGQEHFSVLEHSSATFYVAGVSRSLSHELVRHRHLSFSQLSQRYVDERDVDIVYPPGLDENTRDQINTLMPYVRRRYVDIVVALEKQGLTRKEARQAARSVLPNATETQFAVTGNMRAWRDVIKKRISLAADAEIRQLATEILRQLREIAPNTFQDM